MENYLDGSDASRSNEHDPGINSSFYVSTHPIHAESHEYEREREREGESRSERESAYI